MNILTGPLPNGVLVDGRQIGLRTDFRLWIEVGELFRDAGTMETAELVKRLRGLVLEPGARVSDPDVISAAALFYRGFPRSVGRKEPSKEPSTGANYDFAADAAFVYASFAAVYGIRLIEVSMHWFEFLTLFEGLMFGAENAMSFVVATRSAETKDVPKSERSRIARLKREFALPVSESEAALIQSLTQELSATEGGSLNG